MAVVFLRVLWLRMRILWQICTAKSTLCALVTGKGIETHRKRPEWFLAYVYNVHCELYAILGLLCGVASQNPPKREQILHRKSPNPA